MGNLKRRGSRKRGAKVRISKMKEETRDDKDLIYEGIAINQFFFKRFASNYQTTKT